VDFAKRSSDEARLLRKPLPEISQPNVLLAGRWRL